VNTYRQFVELLGPSTEAATLDPLNARMRSLPLTVVSSTLEGPLDWPGSTVVNGDAVDIVARLKAESELPLRSHGSLSLNRAVMAAGLVDRVQLTIFPVITGQTGVEPIFEGAADFDLELLESHGWAPEVIGAVGEQSRNPDGYLGVFFTRSAASRQAGVETLGRLTARHDDPDTETTWQTRQAQYDAVCEWASRITASCSASARSTCPCSWPTATATR
jgi:dihydrofolate reductase